MDRFTKVVSAHWRGLVGVGLIVLIAGFLLLYKLGSLTHGLSAGELNAPANSWSAIWRNPLNLPLHLLRFALPDHNQFLLRLPSVIFGALTLLVFAYILRKWYGRKAMFYGLALFGFSSWFLHVSRLNSPGAMYLLAVPTLIAATLFLQRGNKRPLAFYGTPLVLGLLLYIPGLIWLVVLNTLWHRAELVKSWRHFAKWWQRLLSVTLFALTMALLVISLIRTPQLIKPWLGLPEHFASIGVIAKNFGEVFLHIFIRGAHQPELWLGNLPILSAFVGSMFVIGAYFYARHWRAQRSQLLLAFILLSAGLVALGGPVSLSLVVSLIYLVAVAGLGYLLRKWLQVFPKNPLARSLGITVIAVAVAIVCLYNVRQYFVAWPHNTRTEAAFHNHLKN